ncbi:MAG: S41 family peptidase [Acetatifactor sp.]|nr:S41 family peptidase [Acetatifactor sp.]
MNEAAPSGAPRKERGAAGGIFVVGMILGVAISLLIVGIVYVAFSFQKVSDKQQETVSFQENSVITPESVKKLQALETTINKYFFLDKADNETLQEGLYKGLLSALDDPYTEYYSAEELEELMQDTEGIYFGIGAYVGLDSLTSLPKISGVIGNSPAEEADLRPNDLVYEVDGTSTYGLTLTEAVNLIRGPEGTQVELTIVREGAGDYLHVTLTRRKVETPTVEYEMLEDDMGLISVSEFDDVTVDQFADALATVKGSGAKGIILDLRGNPGGSLSAVVSMCRMILPEGLIVYTEDKSGKRSEYTCDGSRKLTLPLVVLVDMNSASAAEIMAGAIQDHGLGTLVGTTTFGKGIVQQIVPFKDGSAVKITISAYFTPSGKNIHGIGIVPDVECEFDGEAYYGSEDHPDNQLEKAKEVLREKIK